jgi:hypothetical protein
VREVPVPPERIRRFVASEWGWFGPACVDGYVTVGHYEAERRYLSAWSAWTDENDVDLMTWFDRYGEFR